jgi:hypothetical protein
VAGYARPELGLIVLFPSRTPSYPHDSLDAVLQHELAHVLVTRAAGGHSVPRWFHEGVALAAERSWGLGDRARLAYEVALRGRVRVDDLGPLFDANESSATRAYTLAGAFVQDLLREYGPTAAARVLVRVADGRPFEAALDEVTGESLTDLDDRFWERMDRTRWLSFVTSSTALWITITLLAIWAMRRRRAERAALRRARGIDDETEPPKS